MNPLKQFSYTSILPVLSALAVTLFLGLCYPHHLHFQEQFQLFLFDGGYALDVLRMPGGTADYLGRFVTQFFLFAWPGAIMTGLLIGAVHLLSARNAGGSWICCLSILPALLLTRALCDENFLTGSILAILLVQLAAWVVTAIGNDRIRPAAALIALPLLYWMAGPIACLLVVLVAIDQLRRGFSLSAAAYLFGLVIVALAIPAFASRYLPIEEQYLYSGVHYYRSHQVDTTPLWLAVASAALPALAALLWKKGTLPANRSWMPAVATLLIAVAGSAAFVYPAYNGKAEAVMGYDFMARMQQWNRIQATARENAPNNAVSSTVHNLALAQSGRMADHMFEYNQRGTAGLLPPFESDAMSPLATSEVFYHLGMINTAQRFVFEAQEAILDYQKSGRCYKSLAETNLICGNYEVARKYLTALQKTLFYRDWANRTMQLLGDENAINSHKEYGLLRKIRSTNDQFYNENEYPQMLSELYLSNKSNKLAFDYLLATCMLQKDLDRFVNIFGMNDAIPLTTIPLHYQQALILWWSRDHNGTEQIPPGINPEVDKMLKRFIIDLQQQSNNRNRIKKQYGKTYWYYYFTD